VDLQDEVVHGAIEAGQAVHPLEVTQFYLLAAAGMLQTPKDVSIWRRRQRLTGTNWPLRHASLVFLYHIDNTVDMEERFQRCSVCRRTGADASTPTLCGEE
jgi:hypothetical protein